MRVFSSGTVTLWGCAAAVAGGFDRRTVLEHSDDFEEGGQFRRGVVVLNRD